VFRRRPTPEAEAAARDRLAQLAAPRGRAVSQEWLAGIPLGVLAGGPRWADVDVEGGVAPGLPARWIVDPRANTDPEAHGPGRSPMPANGIVEVPGSAGRVESGPALARTVEPPATPPRSMPGVGPPASSSPPAEGAAGLTRIASLLVAALPAPLRGARLDPGRRGVVVVALVALVAAAVAGVGAWRARPTPEPLAAPVPIESSGSPSAGPVLVVAVAGKVRRPGVVRLPSGSRVADAITAAGGAVPGADLGLVNLARKVVDGEQVVVGVPAPGAGPVGAAPPAPGSGALLDLNTATVAQLDELPGVGPVLAQRLIDYRTANGGFRSVDQLREVDGIGESRFQKLKELVTV